MTRPGNKGLEHRIARVDWPSVTEKLDAEGWALLPKTLTAAECRDVAAFLRDEDRFRRRIVMQQHNYGQGEYRYFRYPLPDLVSELRTTIYPRLAPLANRWNEAMRSDVRFPDRHKEFIERCHKAGQSRPTPLLLQYGPGDYNCLHQDLYGEHVFPMQVALLLSQPGKDFTGGELVLTEQRPRKQSRVTVVPLERGDGVVFAVRNRPVQGARGIHRVTMRHGVSPLHSGHRYTLGVIFHDAT